MKAGKARVFRALTAVGVVALLASAMLAQTAGAGIRQIAAPLTVVKVVDPAHPAPPGTTFTATVHCDGDIIDTGVEAPSDVATLGTDTATITFDATGQPTSPDTIGFVEGGSCTVTETATGGAATTTYACEGVEPVESGAVGGQVVIEPTHPICPTSGPQTDPITVNIEFEAQTATVTITNTFAPQPQPQPQPQPAAQIVARPAFTG